MDFNINIKNIYAWPLSRQLLILGLIFVITFYIGNVFDLASLRDNLETIQHQEADLKQQLEISITKEINLKNELASLPKIQLLLEEWQKKLIHYSDLPDLLNEILKIGANNHLYFALFDPADEVEAGLYNKIPVKTIVVGSYHQIADFISQLANMSWIIVVSDFTISNENKNDVLGTKLAEQANLQNLLTGEITLEIYRLLEINELKAREEARLKKEKEQEKSKSKEPQAGLKNLSEQPKSSGNAP